MTDEKPKRTTMIPQHEIDPPMFLGVDLKPGIPHSAKVTLRGIDLEPSPEEEEENPLAWADIPGILGLSCSYQDLADSCPGGELVYLNWYYRVAEAVLTTSESEQAAFREVVGDVEQAMLAQAEEEGVPRARVYMDLPRIVARMLIVKKERDE